MIWGGGGRELCLSSSPDCCVLQRERKTVGVIMMQPQWTCKRAGFLEGHAVFQRHLMSC